MAVELPLFNWTFKATATLAAAQWKVVMQDTSNPGNVVLSTAITDHPIGILQDAPAAGEAGNVCIMGISKFIAQGTIHVGDMLGLGTTDGGLTKITLGTDTTVQVLGQALSECADGDIGWAVVNFSAAGRAA